MSSGITFGAPWGKPLKGVTIFTTVLLLGIVAFGFLTGPRRGMDGLIWFSAMVGLPLLIVFFSLPFGVRGYVLTRNTMLIRRIGWYSRIDLGGLVDVQIDPRAMAGSIRTFGNGGLFGFTGWYWNKKLRSYKAYVTDFRFCVVLRFSRGVIVVSPDAPEAFVRSLRMLRGI